MEVAVLTLGYLAPRPPLSSILGPPIRAFFHYPFYDPLANGEAFLHYPINMLLLPRLFTIGRIVIGATGGVILTALAIRMVAEANEGVSRSWGINLREGVLRYFTLFTFWMIVFLIETSLSRWLPNLAVSQTSRRFIRYALLPGIILVKTFFAYGLAAIILEKRRVWRAIVRTLSVAKSTFFPTLILVAIPLILQILFTFVRGKNPQLMTKFFPEITLFVLGGGILLGLITDCVLRVSTTILFLVKSDTEKG